MSQKDAQSRMPNAFPEKKKMENQYFTFFPRVTLLYVICRRETPSEIPRLRDRDKGRKQ